jgi:hypothetical protein
MKSVMMKQSTSMLQDFEELQEELELFNSIAIEVQTIIGPIAEH